MKFNRIKCKGILKKQTNEQTKTAQKSIREEKNCDFGYSPSKNDQHEYNTDTKMPI